MYIYIYIYMYIYIYIYIHIYIFIYILPGLFVERAHLNSDVICKKSHIHIGGVFCKKILTHIGDLLKGTLN